MARKGYRSKVDTLDYLGYRPLMLDLRMSGMSFGSITRAVNEDAISRDDPKYRDFSVSEATIQKAFRIWGDPNPREAYYTRPPGKKRKEADWKENGDLMKTIESMASEDYPVKTIWESIKIRSGKGHGVPLYKELRNYIKDDLGLNPNDERPFENPSTFHNSPGNCLDRVSKKKGY